MDFLAGMALTPQTSISRSRLSMMPPTIYWKLQQWQQAILCLEDFKQRFARSPLAQSI